MYNDNKYTEVYLKIRGQFNNNLVKYLASIFEMKQLESIPQFNPEKLLQLQIDKAYEFRVFFQESGFDFRIYRSSQNWFSIRLYRFADFLTVRGDYDECEELVFDAITYLKLIAFICNDLYVEKIKFLEDSESEHSPFQDPLPNSVYVFTGATYHFRSPYQYLMTILNNILENNGKLETEIADFNEYCKQLANQLKNNEQSGVSFGFTLDTKDFELIIFPQRLILKPFNKLLMKNQKNVEFVDVLYYMNIMLFICKDLGIRDLETYFDA